MSVGCPRADVKEAVGLFRPGVQGWCLSWRPEFGSHWLRGGALIHEAGEPRQMMGVCLEKGVGIGVGKVPSHDT